MVPFTPPYEAVWSYADLCEYLVEEEVAHLRDDGACVVEIPTAHGALPLLLRWEWHRPLVQIVQPIAIDVPVDRLAAIELTLARLNHAAPAPGYAVDLDRRFAYYRVVVERTPDQRVPVGVLNRAMLAAVAGAATARGLIATLTAPAPLACAA